MSIRIHKLAEELGLDNKEMMALLKERRIIAQDVKSVSSTVDNINASALREEFAAKKPAAPAAVVPAPAPPPPAVEAGPVEASTTKVVIRSGVFVKSQQDIDRGKEVAAAARAAAAKAPAPPAAPVRAPALTPSRPL